MNKQKFELANIFLLCVLIVSISGCSSWVHKYEPKKFGGSVRSMVKAQIYDRSTIKNPPTDVVTGMDSTKSINDLRKVYRKTVANKQQVKVVTTTGKK